MTSPTHVSHERRSAAGRLVRAICIGLTALSAIGLGIVSFGAGAQADASSAVTIAWTGDASSASAYQPKRDTTYESAPGTASANPHYANLQNLKVTVDQTTNLIDQAVTVHVSGFAGTVQYRDSQGAGPSDSANFVQAMQCWGQPSSPTFYQTCEWGGYFESSTGNLVETDDTLRVASTKLTPPTDKSLTPLTDPSDVPFVGVDGSVLSGREATPTSGTVPSYPLFQDFNTTTSNEVLGARINNDGTGQFDFETQNSDTAPALGCGSPGHLRCYLVIVPRDDAWGGGKPDAQGNPVSNTACSNVRLPGFAVPSYGQSGVPQGGSPINPACDYWDNRVVVPLDFTPTGQTCAEGSTERRTVGSDLLVGAMASWQPALCKSVGKIYSFDTNPDDLSRSQLVEGQTDLEFSPGPVTKDGLSTDDQTTLASTQLSYAPVASTSAVFGFFADGRSGRIASLNLTPRLVAKLLTQSYTFTVPIESADPVDDVAHLPAQNRKYIYWYQDPDFEAANPNWQDFANNPALSLPGPYASDVVSQLWKWIDGDADARAFLDGQPDPWGMTVNPYYLPKGDPKAVVPTYTSTGQPVVDADGNPVTTAVGLTNLDGTPLRLSQTPQSTFIKADATLVPLNPVGVRYPFGSIQAQPYSQDFISGTRIAFRSNPGAKTLWDPTAIDSSGQSGAWVSSGPQVVGQRFTIAFTDAASARLYDLTSASLTLDNTPTESNKPTDSAMNAALASGLTPTSVPAVQTVDPTKVSAASYPLTDVVYAAVNLTSADADARSDFAKFITQVTTVGQVSGSAVGELPPGYVPLNASLASQAASSATAISTYAPPAAQSDDSGGYSGFPSVGDGGYEGTGVAGNADSAGTAGDTAPSKSGATITTRPTSAVSRTPAVHTLWLSQVALLASLIAGVAGSIVSPWLFRRRRIG